MMEGTMGPFVGLGVVALTLIALARTLLLDRAAFREQAKEIGDLRKEIATLRAELDVIRMEASSQRSLKHDAIGRAAAANARLTVMRLMASKCTCGAWSQIDEFMTAVDQEPEMRLRRYTDPGPTP